MVESFLLSEKGLVCMKEQHYEVVFLVQSRKRNDRIAPRNLEMKKCEIEYEQKAKKRKTGCVENGRRGRESG